MDKPIELVPLVCPQCSTPVPAEIDEVAWVCAQCGQGLALDQAEGIKSLRVNYHEGIPANTPGHPYWVTAGQVKMERSTYGSKGDGERASQEFWSEPRRFYVPAYKASLETLLAQATGLLRNPPVLHHGPAAPFKSVTMPVEDVRPAVEFIVMAIEAERPDKIKRIEFSLELSEPFLWILP